VQDERERVVLEQVARASGWETRPSPASDRSGDVLTGRGVALVRGFGSYVATVCEVEVDRRTGRVRPIRFVVAHDCGLIINPLGLRLTIEGNVLQAASRALCEEVGFDTDRVTSVDWLTYPILEIDQAPDVVETVLIDRPDLPAGGAGEPTLVTVGAAIANAVFDATGARVRRLPLTAERVKAALA
jgi:CO/xanthine dehydrogenase Mo-binding subunit